MTLPMIVGKDDDEVNALIGKDDEDANALVGKDDKKANDLVGKDDDDALVGKDDVDGNALVGKDDVDQFRQSKLSLPPPAMVRLTCLSKNTFTKYLE